MARSEVMEKLNAFLLQHNPLEEECHVVYFMVEIRKILDHENNNSKYPLLKFYSDWTVHTEKTHISSEIKKMMNKIYQTASDEIANPTSTQARSPIMQFAYMEELGKEIKQFLESHGLNLAIASEKDKWIKFIQLLIGVLENQPINNPTKDIEYFRFEPANPGCVIGTLKFKQLVGGYPSYTFKSASCFDCFSKIR